MRERSTGKSASISADTFPIRVASRLAGVAPERIRAWETRYGAVRPRRTAGGSRRYSLADVDRLRSLREGVEAGHRIGDLVGLDPRELAARLAPEVPQEGLFLDEAWRALAQLDGASLRGWLARERDRLGVLEFAKSLVLPLVEEIGGRWEAGVLTVAEEHLATGVIRSMLCESLHESANPGTGLRVLFGTASGERHDLGMLVAALVAAGAGANPIVLGADLPESDLLAGVAASRAEVLAVGFVVTPVDTVEQSVRNLRRGLDPRVDLWLGGRAGAACRPLRGVDRVASIEQVEAFSLAAVPGGRDRQTAPKGGVA